ncbi:hypothetical protein, partial [Peribacillus simplex]|uniref:hypothetical protein n=1 Tax=Peribacillus simplex TaxID=1478 RepID=UPI003D2DD672
MVRGKGEHFINEQEIHKRKTFQIGRFQTVDKLDENRVCLLFYGLYNLNVDFHSRHSLSAGGP